MSRYLLVLSLFPILGACNPNGTCVKQMANGKSLCSLESPKAACDPPSEFFQEEKAAGVVRCKDLGYDEKMDEKGLLWRKSTAPEAK